MTGERPLTAFLDANALYPAELRNLLMRLALAEAYRPRWSDHVQKEWTEALARDRADLPRDKIERVRGHFRGETFWTRSIFLPPWFRTSQWLIWQYHHCGRRAGVTGPVDLNAFRGSRRAFDAFVAGGAGA